MPPYLQFYQLTLWKISCFKYQKMDIFVGENENNKAELSLRNQTVQHDDAFSCLFCLVPLTVMTYISNSTISIISFILKGFHAFVVILLSITFLGFLSILCLLHYTHFHEEFHKSYI